MSIFVRCCQQGGVHAIDDDDGAGTLPSDLSKHHSSSSGLSSTSLGGHHQARSPQVGAVSFDPRLSFFPTLPSTEPLELLAQANETICERDALQACKHLAELSGKAHHAGPWMREQVALCLARACLLLGDIFPLASRFPPADELLAALLPDEQALIAVVVHDPHRHDLDVLEGADGVEEELHTDGLASFPVTFFRAHNTGSTTAAGPSREFHAEAVMLSSGLSKGQTVHLQDLQLGGGLTGGGTGGAAGAGVQAMGAVVRRAAGSKGKTYFARRLLNNAVVVVCFPKSLREANDHVVNRFLDRLGRLFILS